ncbi:MAG TPA: hypothetical protein VJY15_17910, partial [Candidatus Acidoferrum sp.]|nr:hypothetical protein [Candidatus Acidoferrum sp.]
RTYDWRLRPPTGGHRPNSQAPSRGKVGLLRALGNYVSSVRLGGRLGLDRAFLILTRSLADFAKLVELFDAYQVSFVSVTPSGYSTHRK